MNAVQMPLLPTEAKDAELLRLFAAVVDRVTLKEAAYELSVTASYLAHCCAGRNNNHVRAEWLSWAVRQPGGEELLAYLAALAGFDLVPAAPLEPAAELAAIKDALRSSLSPEVVALIEGKARKVRR